MAIPKYQHIKDELKQQIISGKFENGDKFYTEAELIKIYDVSSITVVRALNDLAADGYIEFSDVETFPIQKAKVKVLSIKRGNTLNILDKLGLNPTQFYYKIERTRQIEDDTYIFHQTYIPEQYINPNYPNLEYYSSIYDRFKEDYHIHMNDEHFEEVNEIVFPTPSKVAKVLKIDENFPTVKQVKTTKLEATGQILEYTETYKRGDYYKIKFISCSRDH